MSAIYVPFMKTDVLTQATSISCCFLQPSDTAKLCPGRQNVLQIRTLFYKGEHRIPLVLGKAARIFKYARFISRTYVLWNHTPAINICSRFNMLCIKETIAVCDILVWEWDACLFISFNIIANIENKSPWIQIADRLKVTSSVALYQSSNHRCNTKREKPWVTRRRLFIIMD